jgi:hypothetical protein
MSQLCHHGYVIASAKWKALAQVTAGQKIGGASGCCICVMHYGELRVIPCGSLRCRMLYAGCTI